MSVAQALLAAEAELWGRIGVHPFVRATADGSLDEPAFDRWLLEDHAFVVAFRRFLAGLITLAPDEPARDVLSGGLAALTPELELFRAELAARELDPQTHEPGPTALGYTGVLLASLTDGYDVALAVLFGAEKAYLDAWTAVRAQAGGSRYQAFVDNWSSPEFAGYVDALGHLLGPWTPTADQQRAFHRVVRLELRFWDAVHAGETWELSTQ